MADISETKYSVPVDPKVANIYVLAIVNETEKAIRVEVETINTQYGNSVDWNKAI